MKCTTYIDKNHTEEVLIYAHERNNIVKEIERITSDIKDIIGFNNRENIILDLNIVSCFISDGNKVYALINNNKYQVKQRLYQLIEILGNNYIRINQSCIANIKQIKNFKSSIGGAILVTFKNNYSDYISRRELKNVKERLGL